MQNNDQALLEQENSHHFNQRYLVKNDSLDAQKEKPLLILSSISDQF